MQNLMHHLLWFWGMDLPGILTGFGIRLLIIFLITPIHESAHAWAAYKLGDGSAKAAGRITLNPLPHIDLVGALLLLFVGFGWGKPVMVYPQNFRDRKNWRRGHALVAAAGPASNILAAIAGTLIYRIIICFPVSYAAFRIISDGYALFVSINVTLAVFNLLPIQPLDGSHILNWLLPEKWASWIDRNRQLFMIGLIMLVMMTNVLDIPIFLISSGIMRGIGGAFDWIFGLFGL